MADAKPLYDTYNRVPIVFERGHGVWLETPEGERYLDFAAGIAVNSLGHTHPHLVEALKAQADRLWHLSNVHEIPDQSRLARRLTEVTFAEPEIIELDEGQAEYVAKPSGDQPQRFYRLRSR